MEQRSSASPSVVTITRGRCGLAIAAVLMIEASRAADSIGVTDAILNRARSRCITMMGCDEGLLVMRKHHRNQNLIRRMRRSTKLAIVSVVLGRMRVLMLLLERLLRP